MKRFILAIALLFIPSIAWAQCTGVFPANTLCGNLGASAAPPAAFSAAGTIVGPASSTSSFIPTWIGTGGTQLGSFNTISTSQAVTFTGVVTFTSAATFTNTTSLTSASINIPAGATFQTSGVTLTLPVSGTIPALALNNTWTGTNTFTGLTSISTISLGNSISVAVPMSVSIGGTGVTSIPVHSLLIGETTTTTSNTTPGTLGQCITSNGASADPTFASGCWTLLSSTTATSGAANITDTTHITTSYNDYELSISNCIPANNNVTLILLNTMNGGVATSNYQDNSVDITTAGSVGATTSASAIPLSATGVLMGNSPTIGWEGYLRLAPTGGANQRRWNGQGAYDAAGVPVVMLVTGYTSVAGAVTGYQLQFTNGNIVSCTAKLYGKL